ncbi:hypothetical protein RFI_35241 [Reticulomyxa filosa]|uniref:Uncharacterized protein n=1 Tax=Reticulomyxa filosa TaxID=46433 RepID=X6LM08_RETFI|nr:hypothetical protein RFI_35241 [Reticulomyxa filosa]|eukprot:ETO02192.1 hypothetical protein RFI_35241 [Reticulomyxa filosa]
MLLLDTDDDILSFLINPPVRMKQEQAESLFSVLRDGQECTCMEDVARLTEKDWEEVFNKVELKTATKGRLNDAIKDMSKKLSIPTPVDRTINKQAAFKKKKNRITEVVLVSKIVKRINSAYVTLKNNMQVAIHLNDEKWKHLEMQEGDEIECRYSINESSSVTIHDIQFPKICVIRKIFVLFETNKNVVGYDNKGGLLESWSYFNNGSGAKTR